MKKILMATLILTSNISFADTYPQSDFCHAPSRPFSSSSQSSWNRFINDTNEYQNCINQFIQEQNEGIQSHQQAINDAINDWNNFVSRELN